MREFDPVRFPDGEKHHSITVDQLDGREIDGDDPALLERDPEDFQVVPCNPPADAQDDPPFNCQSVDPVGHGLAAYARPLGQTGRHPRFTKSGGDSQLSVDPELVNLKNPVDVVNPVKCGVAERASAELELRLVNVQRLDAVVERGWRHAELHGST